MIGQPIIRSYIFARSSHGALQMALRSAASGRSLSDVDSKVDDPISAITLNVLLAMFQILVAGMAGEEILGGVGASMEMMSCDDVDTRLAIIPSPTYMRIKKAGFKNGICAAVP